MLILNDKELQILRKRINAAQRELAEEKLPLRDHLARLYAIGLRDKTFEQGLAMADRMIEIAARIQADYVAAADGFAQWFDSRLETVLCDKTLEEQCQLLFRTANELDAANAELLREHMADMGLDVNAILETLGSKRLTGEADEALLLEQRARLRNAVTNFGGSLLTEEAAAYYTMLSTSNIDFGVAAGTAFLPNDDPALVSMVAYIAIHDGSITSIPTTEPETIAAGVCAACEYQRLASRREAVAASTRRVTDILDVLLTLLVIGLSVTIAGVVAVVLSESIATILAIAAGVAAAIGFLYFSGIPLAENSLFSAEPLSNLQLWNLRKALFHIEESARRVSEQLRSGAAEETVREPEFA